MDTLVVVSGTNGELLAEGITRLLSDIPGVSTVAKYLVTPMGTYDVIGMEPGTRGLIFTKNLLIGAKIRLGRWFEVWEDHAAVIGRVYLEDFGEGPPEHGMKHAYSVGSTIRLGASKMPVRVIGMYESSHPDAASKIFIPLIKAQQWFDRPETISYAVVSLKEDTAPEEVITAFRQRLPPNVAVTTFSRQP